jgi:hypothetical protein
LIFENLDYEIYNSFGKFTYKLDRTAYRIKIWLEQFYKYVLDLFNLKTNTMKKLMILSIPFLSICIILLFFYSSNAKAQSKMTIREKFENASSNSKFIEWFNSGQIDSVCLRYLDNAYMMPDQYPNINDKRSINQYFNQLYNRGLRFTKVKTMSKIISDSIAIDRGVWNVSMNSVSVASGTYLTQWHYINGKWWIENEMSKSDSTISKEENN